MIPMYNTKKFTDIWSDIEQFANDYKSSTLYEIKGQKYGNNDTGKTQAL